MSDLLKHYMALEDGDLAKRIQGAALKYAHYLQGQPDPDPVDAGFAELILAEPFRTWLDQQIEVISNATVLANISVAPDGQRAFSQAVPDTDIIYVVESTWHKVAAKHVVLPEPEPVPEIIEGEDEGDEIPGGGEG